MKVPNMLKKINEAAPKTKAEVEEIISETLECEYIVSWSIKCLTIAHLDLLAEYAKENNILITLRTEHNNLHQGVLVSLIKKDLVAEFLKYL